MSTSTKVMSLQLDVKNKVHTPNGQSTFVVSAPYGDTPVVTMQKLAVDILGKIIIHETNVADFTDYKVEEVKFTPSQLYIFHDPSASQLVPPSATVVKDFLLKDDDWTEATTIPITTPTTLTDLITAISDRLFPLFQKASIHVNRSFLK